MSEDLLERVVREIRERKAQARAAYEESGRLQAALEALGTQSAPHQGETTIARGTPEQSRGDVRTRRPRGQNRRQILDVVDQRPGVSAGEVASVTGIKTATVASTLAKLAREGDVEREKLPSGRVGFKLSSARIGSDGPAPPADADAFDPSQAVATANDSEPVPSTASAPADEATEDA